MRLRKNKLVAIINDAKEMFDLDESVVVLMALVRKRALRGHPKPQPGGGQVSSMAVLEPLLVAVCIAIQQIHVPVEVNIFFDIVDSLLEGSDLEKEVIDWKVRHSLYKPDPMNPRANLGIAYYKGFMNRNSKEIESKSRGTLRQID